MFRRFIKWLIGEIKSPLELWKLWAEAERAYREQIRKEMYEAAEKEDWELYNVLWKAYNDSPGNRY
ncbi:MAG: hypothetical protein PHQ43_12765 [Dehalococcoidales bacterium]|jgi:hypothetical protein|nr:hypothetical protein [Dehalococcoidales bacterium]